MRKGQERGLELWGGLECTVNRVGDRFFDQFEKGGHLGRPEDLDRVAELGIRTLRYPILWERTAPERPDERDWRFADERLGRIRDLGMDPIVGLVHHGSGPRYTSLLDEGFASGLAEHARAVAERYPWVEAYTPVNEPLTTARFSGLYGHWYPHGRDGRSFARALMNQIRATVLSMAAIRKIHSEARLVQTEDLGKTHATEPLRYQADFENARRWATWDLLSGLVHRGHRLWGELVAEGIEEDELEWLLDNPCPPDVVGINHYLTSERFLDHRAERYPAHTHGRNAYQTYADVEAVRVLAGGVDGATALLRETWERYGRPLAVTECHLGCTREEQGRWLAGVWRQAQEARAMGIEVRAVTAWSLFGAHDWDSLLTRDEGRYEPGAFDLQAPTPRPTALAALIRALATGETSPHEAFADDGWWERPMRLLYEPAMVAGALAPSPVRSSGRTRRPLLIIGKDATLAAGFARLCDMRGLEHRTLAASETLGTLLDRELPWGVIEAAGGHAAGEIADACVARGIAWATVSSASPYDGRKGSSYVESDRPEGIGEGGLTVRCGPLFGPWGGEDALTDVVRLVRAGRRVTLTDDRIVSPSYLPDLVHAVLDLLLDGTTGVVHLANAGGMSWAAFASRAASALGLDSGLVDPRNGADGEAGDFSLESERVWTMRTLDDALARFGWQIEVPREEDRDAMGYLA